MSISTDTVIVVIIAIFGWIVGYNKIWLIIKKEALLYGSRGKHGLLVTCAPKGHIVLNVREISSAPALN